MTTEYRMDMWEDLRVELMMEDVMNMLKELETEIVMEMEEEIGLDMEIEGVMEGVMNRVRRRELERNNLTDLKNKIEMDMKMKIMLQMPEMGKESAFKRRREQMEEIESERLEELQMEMQMEIFKWMNKERYIEMPKKMLREMPMETRRLMEMQMQIQIRKRMKMEREMEMENERGMLRRMPRDREMRMRKQREMHGILRERKEMRESVFLTRARSFLQEYHDIILPTNDQERLEQRLSYFQFNQRLVEQDQNKPFRILSDQLFGNERHHVLMRHAIVTQLVENPAAYENGFNRLLYSNYNTYCDHVRSNHYNGDMLCIKAACDLFAVSFVLLMDRGSKVVLVVAPSQMHGQVICRKVIYSFQNGDQVHSMSPSSGEDHLIDLTVQAKVDDLLFCYMESEEGRVRLDADALLEKCRSLLQTRPRMIFPNNEDDKLSLRLSLSGSRRKIMIGDGNCLFRSLSDQIFNSQEHHFWMRSVIVARLNAFPRQYENLVSLRGDETYDAYRKRMAIDREWGDHGCIQAACDAFGVKIILLDSRDEAFMELVPDGPCKKVIYGCTKTGHMDAMFPLRAPERRRFYGV